MLGIIRNMVQEAGLPQIPCVYCSHPNPPGFRFCGMCGKALPDLVKQASRAAAEVPKPAPPPPVRTPTIARRTENPNRDLSYLLHDDHEPTPTNRTPFIVGALVLAAVAAFFAMRGGGRPATSGTTASETTATAPAETAKTETPAPETKNETK